MRIIITRSKIEQKTNTHNIITSSSCFYKKALVYDQIKATAVYINDIIVSPHHILAIYTCYKYILSMGFLLSSTSQGTTEDMILERLLT